MEVVVPEEDCSREWASLSFAIPKENGASTIKVLTNFMKLNLLLKHRISPIFYSNDWGN
jgi:hypothetical protein